MTAIVVVVDIEEAFRFQEFSDIIQVKKGSFFLKLLRGN